MSTSQTIAIVGAGLTGLTAAFYLQRAGHNVIVLERSSRTGGQIASFAREGYVFESGPNTGAVSHPEVAELFDDLGLELLEARPEAKARWIWHNGSFRALPSGLLSAITTPLFSWGDKLRILGEPFRRKGIDPNESVATLTRRRLGSSYLRNAVDPFISGVYAGNPEQLVTRFALPRLYVLEQNHGSFIRGAIAKARQPKNDRDRRATKAVFSARGGMQTLVDTLAQQFDGTALRTNVQELRITPIADHRFALSFQQDGTPQTLEADSVITTCPAYALPDTLSFLSPAEQLVFANLRYAPIVQAAIAVRHTGKQDFSAFGGLVPSAEGEQVLGILFPSSCFEQRAPEGGALFSCFLGGMRHPDFVNKSDEELRTMLEDVVERMLQLDRNDIAFIELFRHARAIPQYEASSEARLALVERLQTSYPGLHLAGNLRDGIGMADRIKQARGLAACFPNATASAAE